MTFWVFTHYKSSRYWDLSSRFSKKRPPGCLYQGNGGPEIPLKEAEVTPQPPCCPGACQAWLHFLCSAQHLLLLLEEVSEIRSYSYEATQLPEVEPRFRPGSVNPRTKASHQVVVRRGPSWRCIFGNLSTGALSWDEGLDEVTKGVTVDGREGAEFWGAPVPLAWGCGGPAKGTEKLRPQRLRRCRWAWGPGGQGEGVSGRSCCRWVPCGQHSYVVCSFSAMLRSGLETRSCLPQGVSNSKKGPRPIPP